jgi:hypothetical protein
MTLDEWKKLGDSIMQKVIEMLPQDESATVILNVPDKYLGIFSNMPPSDTVDALRNAADDVALQTLESN